MSPSSVNPSTAFLTSLPISSSTHHAHLPLAQQRRLAVAATPILILPSRNPHLHLQQPRMQSALVVASEVGGLSAVAAAAYFLVNNFILKKSDDDDGDTTASDSGAKQRRAPQSKSVTPSSSAAGGVAVAVEPSGGFSAGLASQTAVLADDITATVSAANRPRTMVKVPQGWEITSVGIVPNLGSRPADSADGDDDGKVRDMPQQYEWVTNQLITLEACDGAAIVDTNNGTLIAKAGPLLDTENIVASSPVGLLPSVEPLKAKDLADRDRGQSPLFGNSAVKSFAKAPVGKSGVNVVLLSTVEDFVGPKETLLVQSVVDKLKALLEVDDAKLNIA